jgi:hypothetical protein
LPQTSGYSYPRVTAIRIDVHPTGENSTNTPHAFHAQFTRGPHIATFHTVVNRFEQIHYTREEGLPTQSTARRSSDPRVRTQLLSHNSQRAVGKSQAPIDNRLLGLPGSYHRHAIGMFNTCSRGPIERSLIDTGRGYNLRGAGLPHTHSPTFPTSCPHFSLVTPPDLHFNQILAKDQSVEFLKNLWPPRGLSTTRPSTIAYIYA